ncbi:MAG: di-heme oxidoredictase family protein [Hyphomicrobiaceae bacterium]|nr:di-heme oxidoredictase family protein [Hyphomicrobiaceae bacterium]
MKPHLRFASIVALATGVPLLAGLAITLQPEAQATSAAASPRAAAVLEPGEENPGGSATTERAATTRDAFSQFSEGIGLAGEGDFKVGNAIFRKLWVSAPSSNNASDGLGPIYNARGCQNCHLKDGRGRPPAAHWPDEIATSLFLRLSIPPQTEQQKRDLAERRINVVNEPVYGGQLQNVGLRNVPDEGQMRIDYTDLPVTLGDGTVVTLRKPTYSIVNLNYGPLHPGTMMSPRLSPQMIGMGLLEAIPEADIRVLADPDDKDGNGISGRPSDVFSLTENKVVLGRFGWKAGNASVRLQAADAFSGDMGLSTTLHRQGYGDCTETQTACRSAPDGASDLTDDVEVSDQFLDLVTFYAQNLAVPRRRGESGAAVLAGKATFNAIGCAGCHHPAFTTGDVPDQPHLSKQKIWPYTDMLLHDMGEGLADNRPEGSANGTEWRTAPLWGIGLTQQVSGHEFLLHDGRARGVEEAILWHGGEAGAARNAYAGLAKADRDALIAFVKSL